MASQKDKTERWRRSWDKHAKTYDREMGFFDRHLFEDSRDWVCGQATGDVLEVAIGTGLNLEHYPPGTRLTGIELSPEMLKIARKRATELPRTIDLREDDAHRLEFPDDSFDTVVKDAGLTIERQERFGLGLVERIAARKPPAG